MTEFEFQMLIWGYYIEGGDPMAYTWEYPKINSGHHLWDRRADWLDNFWINDEPAPEWHALYYVARQHLEKLNG